MDQKRLGPTKNPSELRICVYIINMHECLLYDEQLKYKKRRIRRDKKRRIRRRREKKKRITKRKDKKRLKK
jgi:hypothetical protein